MQLKSYYIIRFNDCDPLGHLNNARYLDYLLNAREDHLRDFYQLTIPDFLKQGLAWVVRGHEIQYIRPALYNEKVCIESRLISVNDNYLLLEMLMYDEKESSIKAIAWTNFTCIDPKTGRKQTHTPAFMELAAGMEVHGVDVEAGLTERVKQLISLVPKAN